MTEEKKRGGPIKAVLLVLLFALPVLSGVVPRIFKDYRFFRDYESFACAGELAARGVDYYVPELAITECPHMQPTRYVYPPFVAEGWGWLYTTIGADAERWLFLAFYFITAAIFFHAILLARDAPGRLSERAPFLGMVTGSGIVWGNISIACFGFVVTTMRLARKYPLLYALAVAFAGAIKPQFLLFLMVFLYSDRALWRRVMWFAVGLAFGLGAWAHFYLTGGALFDAWRGQMETVVFDETPGDGYFGYIELLGIDGRNRLVYAGYGVFLVMLTAAGFAIAELGKLSSSYRMWLGLAVASIAFPRVQSQDIYLIGPGMLVVVEAAKMISEPAQKWVRRVVIGGAVAAFILNIGDATDYGNKLAILVFSLAIFWVGARLALRWRGARTPVPASA